jgi:hypothetical protein
MGGGGGGAGGLIGGFFYLSIGPYILGPLQASSVHATNVISTPLTKFIDFSFVEQGTGKVHTYFFPSSFIKTIL